MTDHDPPWTLVAAHLAGEASAEDHAALERWMGEHRDRRQLVAQLQEMFDATGTGPVTRFDLDTVERTVLSEIFLAEQRGPAVGTSMTPRLPERGDRVHARTPRFSKRMWSMTASLMIGAALILALWIGSTVVAKRNRASAPDTTYATRNGQRADITLPDGSVVTLNVASRLEVPANFAQGNRTLRLTGEALVSVAHKDGAPFTVIAGATTARVLGTTFAVRHYATDSTTLVAVREGKVVVQSDVLTARQEVEVSRQGSLRIIPVDSTAFEFATGVLTLGWMPLRDAIVELDRWYDVDIVLADPSLATRPIKASFASGAASDLASILALMLHARVEHEGRRLTIYPI